jgi:hypothetical protein
MQRDGKLHYRKLAQQGLQERMQAGREIKVAGDEAKDNFTLGREMQKIKAIAMRAA